MNAAVQGLFSKQATTHVLATALLSAGLSAHAQSTAPTNVPDAATVTLTSNINLLSQYRFRGIEHTWGKPAVQGGADANWASGWYAGLAWVGATNNAFHRPPTGGLSSANGQCLRTGLQSEGMAGGRACPGATPGPGTLRRAHRGAGAGRSAQRGRPPAGVRQWCGRLPGQIGVLPRTGSQPGGGFAAHAPAERGVGYVWQP